MIKRHFPLTFFALVIILFLERPAWANDALVVNIVESTFFGLLGAMALGFLIWVGRSALKTFRSEKSLSVGEGSLRAKTVQVINKIGVACILVSLGSCMANNTSAGQDRLWYGGWIGIFVGLFILIAGKIYERR